MRILVGIVLYNPSISRLHESIDAIKDQTTEILLIDNGSDNHNDITVLFGKLISENTNVSIKINNGNLGIAAALNQILDYAKEKKFKWFLTLDQDSICKEHLIEKYKSILCDDIGQITCRITDRNTGNLDSLCYSNDGTVEISSCITSGCLNNTSVLNECGGFNNKLFIDGVDIDMSCKLRSQGYKILQIDYLGLVHELGDGVRKRFLFFDFTLSRHQPWRNYYTRRNLIYIARKYHSGITMWKCVIKQIIYAVGIIILEDKKSERIKSNLKGILEGLMMNLNF